MSKKAQNTEWVNFHQKRYKINNFPKYPQDIIIKIIFGGYSKKNKINLKKRLKILDVGCGFGNNLIPFLEKKYKAYGIEISKEICNITSNILKKKYKNFLIKEGNNRHIPFPSNYFDLLISSGVIHYEDSKENYIKALNEYHRVLKKNGVILVLTSGSKNDLRRSAKLMSKCLYKVSINDFRKNKLFYFMNNKRDIISHYGPFFKNIEIGSCSEFFLDKIYDVFIILGKKL